MRYFILFMLFAFPFIQGKAQNNCSITPYSSTATVPCGGDYVDLWADGQGAYTTPINNDFDNGNAGPGWSATPAAQFNNPCDPSVDGGTYMWMGNTTSAPRTLETDKMDVSCGGEICFWFDMATQGGSGSCEGIDLSYEGVYLEYSTNNGNTWNEIVYFGPCGINDDNNNCGYDNQMTAWNYYCFTIPAAAETPNTMFRWTQSGASGSCCDHWGIDNVVIKANSCVDYDYNWLHVSGSPDDSDQTVFVDKDTTFTVCYTSYPSGGNDSCCSSIDITVDGMGQPTIDTVTEQCAKDNDGEIHITPNGGVSPYTYDINGPVSQSNNTGDFTGLPDGTYTVVVTESGGCSVTDTAVLVNGPSCCSITQDTMESTLVSCYGGSDGTATAYAANGPTPYSYTWYDGNMNPIGQTSQTATNLTAGTYIAEVMDQDSCVIYDTVDVNQPPQLVFSNFNVDSADCNGACDGAVSAFPNGGTVSGQYKFYWSNNIGSINEAQPSGICPGNYSLTIEDDNGCQIDTTFVVEDPAPFNVQTSSDSANCYLPDGSATVDNVTGNTPGYSYQWGSGANNQTGATANNLAPGSYDVTITDSRGCDTTVSVTVHNIPGHTSTINVTNTTCYGGSDGELQVQTNGGTPPYTYQWDDPNNQTTQTATGLSAGTYSVIVEDANGCLDTVSATVDEPTQVQATVDPDPDTTICIGGTATLVANASGGTPGYTYNWDQGLGTGQVKNVSPGASTSYQVYVEDANGCQSSAVTTTVNYYPRLSVTALSDDSICPGDEVSLSAIGNGGSGNGYTYNWSNGDQGSNTTVAPSSTTTYSVVLTDNCSTPADTDEVEIYVNPLPDVQFSGSDLKGCTPVVANFSNDTDPGMVGTQCLWDFGNGTQATGCDDATNTFTEPGCYDVTLTVRSPEGCVDSSTNQNMVCVYPYPVADFEFGPQPTTVQDPTIDFTNLSTGASNYAWDFAGLDSSNQEHPVYTFPSQGEGSYPVCMEATTQYGCSDTVCHDVYIGGEFIVYVPNSFTPDGDGVNDKFGPVVQGYDKTNYTFYVFDRWGEIVFESHTPEVRWDGKVKGTSRRAKTDVYVWKLVTKNKFTGETIERVGHVNVIR